MSFEIEKSWREILGDELEKDYLSDLAFFLSKQNEGGVNVYPTPESIFKAFSLTPFDKVKVVILGQDPYHNAKQANGLAFSVDQDIRIPPSLKNIFKELKTEYSDYKYPIHGNLAKWAEQGVLLLNATLTVESNRPGSHQKLGWEIFTDKVIKTISEKRSDIIFLLWGKFAQAKRDLIDEDKHYVLTSPHPSPFSAQSGFFGNGHFTKTNEILFKKGKTAIDWQI